MLPAIVVLLAAPVAAAAPVPKTPAPPDYYPVQKGTTWEYLIDGKPYTLTVAAVEDGPGGRVAAFAQVTKAKAVTVRKDRVTAAGVFTVESYGAAVDPPYQKLQFPPAAKAAWGYDVPAAGGLPAETFAYTVGGVEDVEVPAGKYRTVRVEAAASRGARGGFTNWYAGGVGLVRSKTATSVWELKAFTPGK